MVALYDALARCSAHPRARRALALAVLPVAVITARSDTMDTVIAALDLVALALVARARSAGNARGLLLAEARARPDVRR